MLTWLVWEAIDKEDRTLADYVRQLIVLRSKMGIFDRTKFFNGRIVEKYAHYKIKDMMWLKNDGTEFENTDWYMENRRSLACYVYQEDRSYMMVCNANETPEDWHLPVFCKNALAEVVLDSADKISNTQINPKEKFEVPAWSVVVVEIKKPE